MRLATPTITPPRRPAKKDGTSDRRFGARRPGAPRNACAFTLADYAIAQQHVADLEAAGLICSLEPDHRDRSEVWSVVDPRSGNRCLVWRAGNRVITDSFSPRMDAFCLDYGLATGEPHRRHSRSSDAAWNVVREWCAVPKAVYSFEAGPAAEVIARLPAWLTGSPA